LESTQSGDSQRCPRRACAMRQFAITAATSDAHRARFVPTSTPVFGRNAQIADVQLCDRTVSCASGVIETWRATYRLPVSNTATNAATPVRPNTDWGSGYVDIALIPLPHRNRMKAVINRIAQSVRRFPGAMTSHRSARTLGNRNGQRDHDQQGSDDKRSQEESARPWSKWKVSPPEAKGRITI
jgi:hypothetical protein